jgi:ribose 1,5-bisphosphokinase
MTSRAASSDAKPKDQGLLVLLTGAEARGKDFVIASARRRYAGDPRLEFPARLQTRRCALDSENIGVPRRVFRDIQRSRGFAVSWHHADTEHGLTTGSLEALESGRIVVIAVPPDAVQSFRTLWPNVEVIPLASDVDAARPQTSRAAHATSVHHSGDIAQAVRRFNRVLDDITRRQFG